MWFDMLPQGARLAGGRSSPREREPERAATAKATRRSGSRLASWSYGTYEHPVLLGTIYARPPPFRGLALDSGPLFVCGSLAIAVGFRGASGGGRRAVP